MFRKISLILAIIVPIMAQAGSFNPHKIISDDDLTDYSRMSAAGIQNFLEREGGILSTYSTTDVDGMKRSAAEIIYSTSYRYRLNPQFLLATIQKESSLVTGSNTNLLDWVLGYGVCDGCSKPSKYKGFAKQLDAAGNKIRNSYLADLDSKNSTISGWGVGVSKTTLDGVAITPQNQATAVLYTYTPWLGYYGGDSTVGGNSLFYDVMERFFPNRGSSYLDYPNLSLLQDVSTGTVYKLEHGAVRPITSYTALLANYDPNRIVTVESSVIERYPAGDPIIVPKFLLVQAPSGGIYLIDGDHKRRAITSAEIFRKLGYNPEEVIPIDEAELEDIPEAAPITETNKYPLGALVQNTTNGAIWYLDDDLMIHPIWSKSVLDNRFKGYAIYQESAEVIQQYDQATPMNYADGTLLKIPERDTIYVIDEGVKRPILSDTVLDQLGGYANVVSTSKSVLKLHDTGQPMRLKKQTAKEDKKKTKKYKK